MNPSFFQKLRNDYILLTAFMILVIFGVTFVVILVLQIYELTPILMFSITTTAALIVLLIRLTTLQKLFLEGDTILATIQKKRLFRRDAHFVLEYVYNAEAITKRSYIINSKKARALNVGDTIEILVDPNNPKRHIIKQFYS